MEQRLESPKRKNQKGEARVRDLAKGEVTIMVIARDWKTFKTARPIVKSHETVDVLLQPLDESPPDWVRPFGSEGRAVLSVPSESSVGPGRPFSAQRWLRGLNGRLAIR